MCRLKNTEMINKKIIRDRQIQSSMTLTFMQTVCRSEMQAELIIKMALRDAINMFYSIESQFDFTFL